MFEVNYQLEEDKGRLWRSDDDDCYEWLNVASNMADHKQKRNPEYTRVVVMDSEDSIVYEASHDFFSVKYQRKHQERYWRHLHGDDSLVEASQTADRWKNQCSKCARVVVMNAEGEIVYEV